MENRLDHLEAQLAELREEIGGLARRVGELEGHSPAPHLTPSLEQDDEDWPGRLLPDRLSLASEEHVVPLVGRTLLVLGGAYLLRAVTELGALPDPLGIGLGLAYALTWLVVGDRAAGRGRRMSAVFHTVTALGIAFPLCWEASTRFGILRATGAAMAVALVGVIGVAVAARRELRTPAWIAMMGTAFVAAGLIRFLREPVPLAAAIVVVGIGVLWASYVREWKALPWVAAVCTDVGLGLVLAGSFTGRLEALPLPAVGLLLATFAATLGAIGLRTLLQGRLVGLFEGVQSTLVLALGYGGAVMVARQAGWDPFFLGVAGAVLGGATYAIAFSPGVRGERRRNFFFYTTLGFVLVVAGCDLVLPARGAALTFTLLALACAWLSGRLGRVTLSLHCSLYLLAALVVSGLGRAATDALLRPQPPTWSPLTGVQVAVLAGMAGSLAFSAARTSSSWGRLAVLPRAGLLLGLALAASGALCWVVAPAIAGGGQEFDAGVLEALRTAILCLAALGLVGLSLRERFTEAAWLVYPLLSLVGIKVLVKDLPAGRPLTLFASLAFLGAAIMAAARVLRRGDAPGPPVDAS